VNQHEGCKIQTGGGLGGKTGGESGMTGKKEGRGVGTREKVWGTVNDIGWEGGREKNRREKKEGRQTLGERRKTGGPERKISQVWNGS